jgi:hypothetical protein
MAIPLSDNTLVDAPKPTDDRFGPHTSLAACIAAVPRTRRYKGLPVGILINGKAVRYVFEAGVEDADLVPETASGWQEGRVAALEALSEDHENRIGYLEDTAASGGGWQEARVVEIEGDVLQLEADVLDLEDRLGTLEEQGGSGPGVATEQNLTSNSTTAVPVVKAVNDGLALKLDKAAKADGAAILAGADNTTYTTPKALADASVQLETYLTDIPQSVKDNVTNAANWDASNRYVGPAIPNGLNMKVLQGYSTLVGSPSWKYEFWGQNRVVRIKVTDL